ncbi:hypothetical protein [Aminivibrio sp.]|jgi:hypothetical protein|uniref:hypothetical protein n=1 Tax=Aminivibrio sp. TaxID=1872489 RepID=UPI0016B21425|nr:hypothetical protein [Synergistaceae bacterium]NCC56530.1 hypothetical protein [Synergistales bacterium]MDD3389975.1 hypothetical protein [Synergistaceae bacterium]MDD4021174.1 hypothetical protein [Synergistaceae bacterium]MDD4613544.1 hypothetical protein [Synergistaceae bacterium]
MAMPMQVSLDEILSMLLARVDSLVLSDENSKSKFNIITRVLYKKGIITDDDVADSIREEHRVLKELGLIAEEPGEDVVKSIAENILQWIKGDVEALKKGMEEYERKMQDAVSRQPQKPKIDVAPAAVLQQLNRMGGKQGGGSKLIL